MWKDIKIWTGSFDPALHLDDEALLSNFTPEAKSNVKF